MTAVAEERSLGMPSQSRGSFLWGPLTRFALAIAVATAVVDQAAKLWLLFGLDLPARGIVRLTPFLDLVLTWNTGISYGLFPQDGPLGQAALLDIDLAEIAITSAATLVEGEGPPEAFRLDDVKGVAVEVRLAPGTKCARSWKILPSVGSDPAYPDVSPRDAQALREWDAMRKAAE